MLVNQISLLPVSHLSRSPMVTDHAALEPHRATMFEQHERERRRKPDMWSLEERWLFLDLFLQHGRDFRAITDRIKSKNKEQVRQYYYRALEKVNKLLKPFNYVIRDKSCPEAILALKCFWLLEKRVGYAVKSVPNFPDELYGMIQRERAVDEASATPQAVAAPPPFEGPAVLPPLHPRVLSIPTESPPGSRIGSSSGSLSGSPREEDVTQPARHLSPMRDLVGPHPFTAPGSPSKRQPLLLPPLVPQAKRPRPAVPSSGWQLPPILAAPFVYPPNQAALPQFDTPLPRMTLPGRDEPEAETQGFQSAAAALCNLMQGRNLA